MRKVNYGLNLEKKDPNAYVFGAQFVPTEILQEDGQWDDFLPEVEYQNINGVETQACTIFGTLSALEILVRRLYGVVENWSDRWLAWNAGTDPHKGNDPHRVCETLRKAGVPQQKSWDFKGISSVEDFYKNPPPKLFDEARCFIDSYEFSHEYVNPTQKQLKEALKYSPLGVSVTAWFADGEYHYSPKGKNNNHWCVLFGYNDSISAWKIFDTYDKTVKFYRYGSKIKVAKRYYLKKKEMQKSNSWVKGLFKKLGVAIVLASVLLPVSVRAQGATVWFPDTVLGENIVRLVDATWGVLIDSLASAGNPCLNVDSNGIIGTTTCGSAGGSGLGTTTPWTAGNLAQVVDNDTVTSVATSSLGLPTFTDLLSYLTLSAWYATTTDGLDEGSTNLYFTNTRAQSALSGLYEVPLTFGDGLTRTVNDIDCDTASGSVFGCLTSTDWNTFNGKQPAGNYITALTGEVTASGPGSVAATVADGIIDEANLKITGSPTDLYLLQASSTSAGGFVWVATSTLGFSGGSGTVTSVAQTVPTGLTISGSPITTSGTLAIGLDTGYVIPLTASTTEWDTAYADRHDAVTLAGIPDYITLAGQVITRGLIDLASDITGILPSANVSTSSLNLNHTALGALGFTGSGHTGTAFRLFGTNSSGAAAEYATSSLKLLSSDILEGATNLFYTDARVNTAISASTTVAKGTPTSGNILLGNGSAWTTVGTSSLGIHNPVTLAGENYLSLSNQVITANAVNLSGSNVTGVLPSANVSTTTLNINHSALRGLAFTSSGHTGTAFRLFGTDSSGAAAEYATSSLGLGTVNTGATRTVAYYPTTAASVSPLPLSAITINATNDGVGIFGTAASNAFEVTGAASVSTTFSAGQTITSNNGGFRTATGTAASPVYAGTSANANTGMFIPATDQLGFSIDGTNEMTISSTGLVVNDTVTTPLIYGSSASGGDLELISSSNATKGSITIGQDAAENIGIGTPADPDVGIYISKSWSSNNSGARGIQFFPVLETTATGNSTIAIGGQFRPAAAVAQGTGFGSLLQYGAAQVQNTSSWNITTLNGNTIRVDELSGYSGAVTTLNVLNMTAGLKGGTGTIGTVNVINIPSGHTVYNATNLRGLKSALAASTTAPTSAYNLYIDGTAPNYFAGKVGIGESAPAAELELSSSATTTIQSLSTGAGARGSRIILEDYDGAGCTEIYTLNGTITGRIVTCL